MTPLLTHRVRLGHATRASGYDCDGPAGKLGFAPRLHPENFKSFFTAAEGWGSLVQKRDGDTQTNAIELKWGSLRLKTLTFELPQNAAVDHFTLTLDDKPLVAEVNQHGRNITYALAEEQRIETGQRLSVVATYDR